MNFGDALAQLEIGLPVRRQSWETGLLLRLNRVCRRIVVICQGHSSEWIPTQASILAIDWEIAPLRLASTTSGKRREEA
jgi:hypothetical protein